MQVSALRDRSPQVVLRLLLGVVALASAGAAAPASPLLPAQKQALAGIRASAGRGQLDPATAGKDRTLVNRAAALVRDLPPGRAAYMEAQLAQVAAQASRFSTPRALTLFGQLQANEQWFAKQAAPTSTTDITDTQGVVYRFFPHRGFEFHPLANASALDNAAAAKDTTATQALAQALVARGIAQPRGGIGWEYEFDFGAGRAPWLSGMAQAVFAQAFARASTLLGDPSLMAAARGAFRTIPGRLVQQLPAGPWIRLYGFNRDVVLNAQLQSVVSLAEYAGASDDATAASLANRMQAAASAELPRFDTGYWSYYALPHTFSPLDYQQYVVTLLQKLAPKDPAFAAAAARFNGYDTQPPAFRLADAGPAEVKFWLSKPATVAVSAVGPAKRVSLGFGWHVLKWKLPKGPGIYPVHITATDWAGNTAAADGLPLVRVAQSVATRRYASRVSSPATGQAAFAVGVRLDDPSQAPLATRERLRTIQVGVQWAGQSTPDPTVVSSLYGLAAHTNLVVELQPQQLPADDAGRATLAGFVTSLLQQVTAIHDLLLGPAPSAGTAAAYLAALGAIDNAAKAAAAATNVGAELDGTTTPQTVLNALARAYSASGRTTPPMDELALRPAAGPAPGAWSVADYAKAAAAVTKAFGALPILYDGVAAPPGLGDADQASAYANVLQSASCQPQVAGVVFARLVDTSTDTSGFYAAADGSAKASAATLKPLIAAAQRGALATCPGIRMPAATSVLAFPSDLSTGVEVGCVRDCLFLLTLERASDGQPVLADRGTLDGGAAPATIGLPTGQVPPGSYVLTLRLVTQANPGPVRLVQSAPLTTS